MIRTIEHSNGEPGINTDVLAYIDEDASDGVMMVSGSRFYLVDAEFMDSATLTAAQGGDPGTEDEDAESMFDRLHAAYMKQVES